MTTQDLEILIATMDKSNLDFLSSMFKFAPFENFNILIVNQSISKLLTSPYSNVRVINSTEKGISKSRNLAIDNAKSKICLIADDDVVFMPNFDEIIINAFNSNVRSAVLTFNHSRNNLNQHKSLTSFSHSKNTIFDVCSIEIVFNLKKIKEKHIHFDERFGLGSIFESAEEYLFLHSVINSGLEVRYVPDVICTHPLLSSGKNMGDNAVIFARAALNYKLYGWLAYLWLVKYVFFLYRHRYINAKMLRAKYIIGLKGIKTLTKMSKKTMRG